MKYQVNFELLSKADIEPLRLLFAAIEADRTQTELGGLMGADPRNVSTQLAKLREALGIEDWPDFRPRRASFRAQFLAAAEKTRELIVAADATDLCPRFYAEVLDRADKQQPPAGETANPLGPLTRFVLDNRAYIEEKIQGFVGRDFVFNAIDEFMQTRDRGYFVLEGDPGIGKTSLASKLVHERDYLHHFNIRSAGISRPEIFLKNVSAQIVTRFGLPYTAIPGDLNELTLLFNNLLAERAGQAQREKDVIVIDALDEADGTTLPFGANPLCLPKFLPAGWFFVVTTRPLSTPLDVDVEKFPFSLQASDANNESDVRQFVESQLETNERLAENVRRAGMTRDEFVELLAERSEGNFMYLHYVLPEIARGSTGLYIHKLPQGLSNYYERHWMLMRQSDAEAWTTYRLPILMLLSVVQMPVPVQFLDEASGVNNRQQVRQALDDWHQFLHQEEVDYNHRTETCFSIYHQSFKDFLSRKPDIVDLMDQTESTLTDWLFRRTSDYE